LKIYFAGSIRGGRGDAELYARLIARMKERHTVLTEHIGSPVLFSSIERGMTDEDIYRQDMGWLRESDIVIAECSTPSLGVGYELAFAEKLGKPVHIFHNTGRGTLSAMLTGDSYFSVHPYETEAELFRLVEEALKQ